MMKKLVLTLFLVFGLVVAVAAVQIIIKGHLVAYQSLDIPMGSVTTISSTIYRPAGAGTNIYPCVIEPKGIGYYRLDPYASVGAAGFTPTANDFVSASGDYIAIEQPQWFRMTPSAAAFSAPVASFAE
jgi:hypothetical protein